MPDLFQALDPVASPGGRRTRPVLAVKGKRRKMIQHLLKYLRITRKNDTAEYNRALKEGYTPTILTGNTNSLEDRASLRMIAACEEILAMKAQ